MNLLTSATYKNIIMEILNIRNLHIRLPVVAIVEKGGGVFASASTILSFFHCDQPPNSSSTPKSFAVAHPRVSCA